MTSFFRFCDENAIPLIDVTNINITRYLVCMGDQGKLAADSLHPYMSAIKKLLLDHGRVPVALGPMVAGVRKALRTAKGNWCLYQSAHR
jgi:hypothetical protein